MFVVYVKDECPYCIKALGLLEEQSEEYKIINLTSAPEVWEDLKKAYGWNTVPMILGREDKFFVLVGGFTDLKEYLLPSE
jgi:glutaredoxin